MDEKPSAKQLKVTEGHAGRRTGAGVAKQAHDSPARSPFRKSRDSNKSRGSTSSLLSSHLAHNTEPDARDIGADESAPELPGPGEGLHKRNTTPQHVERPPTNVSNF